MGRILPFTNEHEMFRKAVRDFFQAEVEPYYNQWEKDGIVPRELFKKMGDLGYLCVWADEKYGGAGADFLYSCILVEENHLCGANAVFVGLHSDIVGPYLNTFANEEQKERWLPGCVSGDLILAVAMTEPHAGSDLAAIRTRAIKDGDHYVLNGSKTFISNGLLGDIFLVAVKTDPEAGHRGVSLVVVERDTPGFTRSKPIPKIGLHSQDTVELYFEDCRVPTKNLLGEEGKGFIYLMQKLQQERLIAAHMNVATAQRCFNLTMEYIQQRQAFGKPLSKFQNTQFVMAEIATEIELARNSVDKLILDHMKNENIIKEVSMMKYWVGDMVNRTASRCLQLFGGYGFCEEYEISRHYCDTRIQSIFGGTSEIMKMIIAKELGM